MKILYILLTFAAVGLCSCSSCSRAKEIDERREALRQNDRDELDEARRDLAAADSIANMAGPKLQVLQDTLVVFEKNEKYQSKGFYVLKEHAGDKSQLTFFPEVEEEGQVLLVKIDSNRKWSFLKIEPETVNLGAYLGTKEVVEFVGRELTSEEKAQFASISEFAIAMKQLRDANASIQKNKLKIEFYEKKISQHTNSID